MVKAVLTKIHFNFKIEPSAINMCTHFLGASCICDELGKERCQAGIACGKREGLIRLCLEVGQGEGWG